MLREHRRGIMLMWTMRNSGEQLLKDGRCMEHSGIFRFRIKQSGYDTTENSTEKKESYTAGNS